MAGWPMMQDFIKRDSQMFFAIELLYNREDCSPQHRKVLKYRSMIRADHTLTVKGMTAMYAAKIGIPVMAFKVLALLYIFRKTQKCVKLHPVSYVLIKRLFKNSSDALMHKSIRQLTNNKLAYKHHYGTLNVSEHGYKMLQLYDADITEIEGTFEY